MIDFNKVFDRVCEDAVMGGDAGGAAGDVVAGGGSTADGDVVGKAADAGIKTDDVLGHCDHKKDGYMGAKCFHIPSKLKVPLHRWEAAYGGSKKRKKTPYEQGMVILTDSDKEEVVNTAKRKAPKKVEKIAKLVKSKKQVQKTLDAYEERQEDIDKQLKDTSLYGKLKDTINTSVSLLKDALNGSYKVQWSTIAILTAAIFYVLCPVDLIPDVIPVLGLVDDAAVLTWTGSALKDEFAEYQKWQKSNKKAK